MQIYLHNMKKTCSELNMLGFHGYGYFFARCTRFTTDYDARNYILAIARGVIVNASNVVRCVKGVDLGSLKEEAERTIHDRMVGGQTKDGEDYIRSVRRNIGIEAWSTLFDEPWEKYVVKQEDLAAFVEPDGKFIREYSYREDANPKLMALVDAYAQDPSVASMPQQELVERFGCHPRHTMQFKDWIRTKL